MEKRTISIKEIQENPNLDLSEKISKYAKDSRWDAEDAKELALASIKVEYEFWANNREVVSPRTDYLLGQILNGHTLNKVEGFEMICGDEKKVRDYSRITTLEERIKDNNAISEEDFDDLCQVIGFDSQMYQWLKLMFECSGKIVKSYKDNGEIEHTNIIK